jgi:hypothetical protein
MTYYQGTGYSYGTSYYNYHYPPLPFEEYAKNQAAPKLYVNNYREDPETTEPTPEIVQRLVNEATAVKAALADLEKTFFQHKEFFVVSTKWLNIWKAATCYD